MEEKKPKRNRNRIIIGSHARWVCAHCGSEAHGAGYAACENSRALCAQSGHRQKSGTCPYRVCSTCGAPGLSARECPSASPSASATKTALATKCANVASNMVTSRQTVPNHDAKHAAAYRTETLGALNAQSTSARSAKARSVQTGTIRGLTAAKRRKPREKIESSCNCIVQAMGC